MKFKSLFNLIGIFFLLLLMTPSASAVGNICDVDGTCCTPPQIIIDGGGCPTGTYWIGSETGGSCQSSAVTCAGGGVPPNFNCSTGQCTTVSTGNPTCNSSQVYIGGVVPAGCKPKIEIFEDAALVYKMWLNGILGNVIYSNASGNVGIGTTGPTSKLDISTSLGNVQSNDSGLALVNPTSATLNRQRISPALRLRGNGFATTSSQSQPVDFRSYVFPVQGAANPTGYLTFESSINNAVYSNILTLNSGGNVGIGTNSPMSKLDIEGGVAIGATYSGTTAAPANGLLVEGNVGIGTTTPGAKLEVAGQVKITGGIPGLNKVLTSDATGLATWADPAGGGGGLFVGVSEEAYGQIPADTGYMNVNNYCSQKGKAIPNITLLGSHICSPDEMINSYNNGTLGVSPIFTATGKTWINNGPPGYALTFSNDCGGWTSRSNKQYGSVWDFTTTITPVKDSRIQPCVADGYRFACCR